MHRQATLTLAAVTLALGGCSIDPPIPLEEDPEYVQLGQAFSEESVQNWAPPAMAVAPVALSYLDAKEAYYLAEELPEEEVLPPPPAPPTDESEDGEPGDEGEGEQEEPAAEEDTWRTPPLKGKDLQARLATLIDWALYRWTRSGSLDPAPLVGEAGGEQNERLLELVRDGARLARSEAAAGVGLVHIPLIDLPEAEARTLAQIRRDLVCEAAEDEGYSLLVLVEVLENRVSYLRLAHLRFWTSWYLFWQWGLIVPAIHIPKEVYEVGLTTRITILYARSGNPVFGPREYSVTHEEILSDMQRGWSAPSIAFMHQLFLDADDGDFDKPYEGLFPYAVKKLATRILTDLRAELPGTLDLPQTRELIKTGTVQRARSHAIVVASGAPPTWLEAQSSLPAEDRPKPLLHADKDARAIADHLLLTNTVHRKHLELLVNAPNCKARIFQALERLGPRLLQLDRLVFYFSGFGTTTPDGEPVLVLDDGPLPVRELAAKCRAELVRGPTVVFLLDTSFGKARRDWGRSYRWAQADPGGPPPDAASYLRILGDEQLRWYVLAAAAGNETAYERSSDNPAFQHGFFTRHLLDGLSGRADDPDDPVGKGTITVGELFKYVQERVGPQVTRSYGPRAIQTPRLHPRTAKGALVGYAPGAHAGPAGRFIQPPEPKDEPEGD